jgi:predicted amidohydrolase
LKIAVAQLASDWKNIVANINKHITLIHKAIDEKAAAIFFPELSLTGYEPTQASNLTIDINENILYTFQHLADKHHITIGIGAPTSSKGQVNISMIIFIPNHLPHYQYKKYLHPDEEAFFKPGDNPNILKIEDKNIGIGICYEIFVAAHEEENFISAKDVYIASVAKSADRLKKSYKKLQAISTKYQIPVFIVNSVGPNDDFVSAGGSAIWNSKGEMIAHLDGQKEDILVFDIG